MSVKVVIQIIGKRRFQPEFHVKSDDPVPVPIVGAVVTIEGYGPLVTDDNGIALMPAPGVTRGTYNYIFAELPDFIIDPGSFSAPGS